MSNFIYFLNASTNTSQLFDLAMALITGLIMLAGTWLKMNHSAKKAKKTNEDNSISVIEEIAELKSDVNLIKLSQNDLLELHKNHNDIKNLSDKIDFTNIYKGKVLPNEFVKSIRIGVSEADKIFTHVLRNNFSIKISYVERRILDSFDKISDNFIKENCGMSKYADFKKDLNGHIDLLRDRYLVDLEDIFKKQNGVRRAEFSDKSHILVTDIISVTERIYKKYS